MPKRLLVLVFLFLLLLAACNSAQQTPVSENLAPEAEAKPKTESPTQTSAPKDDVAVTGPQMECTLVSDKPEVPAELVAIFGVTEDDWVKGPDAAAVTFVEYSDFQ